MLKKLDCRGFFHISGIVFLLALVGGWFLYRSYQAGDLDKIGQEMFEDARGVVKSVSGR